MKWHIMGAWLSNETKVFSVFLVNFPADMQTISIHVVEYAATLKRKRKWRNSHNQVARQLSKQKVFATE